MGANRDWASGPGVGCRSRLVQAGSVGGGVGIISVGSVGALVGVTGELAGAQAASRKMTIKVNMNNFGMVFLYSDCATL